MQTAVGTRGVAEVLRHVDADRLTALTVAAVDAYSPTFAEQPATAVFAEHLRAHGLKADLQPVAHPHGGPARANILVRVGPEPLGLLLIGHVDTIPAGAGAMAFRGAHVQGDVLTGLGAADMKAGCAAMVEAALALAAANLPLQRGLGVALVVGEEEYGDGSAALPAAWTAPLCVVGEPTSLQPCTRHFGYLEQHLVVHGERAHAALSAHGGSAIHAMLSWLLAVLNGVAVAHPRGMVSANPRLIRGGDTLFIVAEHCDALLDLHWHPDLDADALIEHIEALRAAAAADHPACRLERETLFRAPAFANDPEDARLLPLRLALAALAREWQPADFLSHSDAGLFQERGAATVVCGPGALAAAHAPGEAVSLAETLQAARLYAAAAALSCLG